MKICEQILNIAWILLGIGICTKSIQMNLWVPAGPGSGLVPFMAGLIIGWLGLFQFISLWSKRSERGPERRFVESPIARKRIIFLLLGFCGMALLLPILGFLFAAMLVTSFLLIVIEPKKILKRIAIAVISCFAVYTLFVTLLRVELPRGFLGF